MKIGEVSARTDLTERTIRFYMEKELIAPRTERRNGREYTDFSEEDVALLLAVATLRELSFSLEDIRTMQRTPDAIPSVVEARRAAAKEQRELAENTHTVLEKLDSSGVRDISTLAARARKAAETKPHPVKPKPPAEVNQSGMGERCVFIPYEIRDKWNWGAFLFPVFWGIYNHVYQVLFTCIPIFGFFYMFHLGSKGNEFAWKHRYWESVEHFKKVQRRWSAAAILVNVAYLSLLIGIHVAEGREAARIEAEELAMKETLAGAFLALPEWEEFLDGRVEWTSAEAEKMEAGMTDSMYAPNPADMFFFFPGYYRILHLHYYNYSAAGADITDAGEVVFSAGDEALSYRVRVQFSDGTEYEIICPADAAGSILGFDAVLQKEASDENARYIAAMKRAGETRREYLLKKTEQVTGDPLFIETFGTDCSFVGEPLPIYESYGEIYDGGNIELGGFYGEVMHGGALYRVEIPAEPGGEEGKLQITKVE